MIAAPVWFILSALPATTADQIMFRVALNQDRSQEMRSAFVYKQNVLVRLQRGNGKLAREEYGEFTVTPAAKGVTREQTLFRGKYVAHGKEIAFDKSGFEHKTIDIDADFAKSLMEDFGNDKQSRDGVDHDSFPLTSGEQRKYKFHLEGEEDYRGTSVYRITFEPKRKASIFDDDNGEWAGEVLVDRSEFQPVLITSHLAFNIPGWVKVIFGTNVQQLGFKVSYKKFDEGLWFPVTYGGEFKLKAVFLYTRRVGLSLQNSDFHRAVVNSKINFGDLPPLISWLIP
ncbi:MAG TPA: hypothetical protein VKT81_02480 [Bryobacteraceae bacterium]|nr:hypothetical protein [Bryobacteraceae bacterium]